jgi:dTDP-4-dehydrorhamnose reductase
MSPSTLLFGATSILGFNLAGMFPDTVLPFITPSNNARSLRQWPALNLGDPGWAAALFKQHEPELLIYCHAVCDVPRCEIKPGWAREINIDYLSRVIDALPQRTRLVYVSSDHVFGGDGVYDEFCAPCPISVYGRTRVQAEEMVLARPESLVLRVGLAIGPSPNGRAGHWDWLRYRTAQNLPMTIVHDEYRSVVWAKDLAARVMQLAESTETGLRHIPATRALSRVELAHHLMSRFGLATNFHYESRHERAAPHLGRVELASVYQGALFRPLPSVIDDRPAETWEARSVINTPSF